MLINAVKILDFDSAAEIAGFQKALAKKSERIMLKAGIKNEAKKIPGAGFF
jgi:hypothetical protein